MLHSIKCLLHKLEDMSLVPQHSYENRGVIARACDLNTGELETGGSLSLACPPA